MLFTFTFVYKTHLHNREITLGADTDSSSSLTQALAGLPARKSCAVNNYLGATQCITATSPPPVPHSQPPPRWLLYEKSTKSTIYFAITHYSDGALTNIKINCSALMNHPLLIPQMRLRNYVTSCSWTLIKIFAESRFAVMVTRKYLISTRDFLIEEEKYCKER